MLHKGKVVETGTHDELLKIEGGVYKKLWTTQTAWVFIAARLILHPQVADLSPLFAHKVRQMLQESKIPSLKTVLHP